MRLWICGVYKLVRNKASGRFCCQRFRLRNGALHALCAFRQNQFRAVGAHQLAALDGHIFRHDNDEPVPLDGGDHCQADALVAAGRLDDRRAGAQLAGRLRVLDHGQGDAVLHAARKVVVFQLREDRGMQAVLFFDVRQLQQRRSADQLFRR